MKKLHTYTRILLSLLLILVTNVVMGQGLNEANIPIQNITAWEQHKVDGHALGNLKDGKEETTWSSYRDGFAVLEYMHVKNPDATANGRRHWVELPYIPNQNTEIEITFKAKTTSGGLKQNIFGFGYPPFGHGMSLNIGGDGKLVYGTSNHIHTLNVQTDNNKHTIICSATSVTIDGGGNLMPGTLPSDDANPSAADIIQDGYTSQHNLCLFSNPGEDQKWARCFDGDIYSVKIRENGKLLYDLVPAKGWWGRPGFYDRISTNVYTFFDMVDYVKNDNTTDNPALHIHYKIPYQMGSGITTGHAWTGDLITNGQFSSSDIDKSFTIENDDWESRVITVSGNKAIQIVNDGTHSDGNSWDTSFTLNLDQELEENVDYELLFYCYAKNPANVRIQLGNDVWLAWLDPTFDNNDDYTNDYVNFPSWWPERRIVIKGKDYNGKKIKSISFDFNTYTGYNKYFLSNIRLRRKSDQVVIFEQGDNYDINSSRFGHRDDWKDRFQNIDGKTCLRVYNNGQLKESEDYARKLDIKLPSGETFAPGDKYYISFYYKAEKAGSQFGTQFQGDEGAYHSELKGNIDFGTSWQKVTWTGEIPAGELSSVSSIGLKLNVTKTPNTYYFTDIVVKKATKVTVPDTELEITYKNTFAGATAPVKTDAVWNTPASNGAWNSGTNAYSWTAGSNNLATVFDTSGGKLANYTSLHFNAADYVKDCPYRVCFMQGSTAKATIVFYSGGQKDLIFAERTETKDLDLSTIDHISFGGASGSGSITVTNMYLEGTGEDSQSTRYLFSYNTREDKVLSLGIKNDQYQYTSGGVEGSIDFNPKNQIITTKFRPMEFEQDGVPFGIMGSPSWDKTVNNLYLFGTHSTSDQYARSFIGEIYGAVIREGDQIKVELQPAWKNGVYGFYDRRSNTFYTKDEDDDNLCGKSANFRGVTGHDAQAPVDHAEGIPQVGSVYPYTLTIDLTNPKIVKNFYMTTAADKLGDYTNNSPARWTLYGSSGDNQWTELYKYEQTVPKFSELKADGNTEYYLYNVETGRFYVGSNEWETRASLSADKAYRFKVIDNGNGKYSLQDFVTRSDINNWKYVFVNTEGNLWSDYNNNADVDYQNWEITHKGNNQYELSNSTFQDGAKVGTSTSSNIDNDNRLYLRTDAKNTTWAFVSEADYNAYQAAKILTKGDPMLNGKEYKYAINAENAEYKQFRLVIDQMVANNNQINLADIAFTSYFDFEHYVGRVYDNMGTPPDNLAIDGSSGYKQAYKMKGNAPDDPRLNEGVTIQRTHEYEHEIYLLPGETVDLTPFSDFGSTEWRAYNYMEQYVRWYNYRTDLRSERLRFDKRDGLNVSTLDKGHFAWNLRDDKRRTREGSLAHYTADSSPTADANGVIDIIAIEAGGTFDWDKAEWNNTKQVYVAKEPTLLWRHTFVIKNAESRADEMFASAAANATYISNHKIKLMCPAGTAFQYPLPSYEYATAGAHHPTDFYYADNNGVYTPVYHYSIKTERWDGSSYVNLGTKTIETTYIPGGLTTPSEAEINAVPDARIVTLTEEEKKDKTQEQINALVAEKIAAFTDEQKRTLRTEAATADKTTAVTKQLAMSYKTLDGYNRVFYMQEPQEGKYQITIYALSADASTPLRLDRFGAGTPLPIMQYELEVLPPADGVMITETELKGNETYAHQRPANMNVAYGKPTTEVNFDDVKPSEKTDDSGHSYLKWPWQWENSSYGFGYENRGDYNMYMVADHMSITPFHGRSTNEKAHKYGDESTFNNVYDRLYNETNGTKKGYFFYANAASDPSRMSVLNIGKNFCPNTKVFVSAWINEFQGQDLYSETANVIFSFRGVKADGSETVLNSFVTGYVPGGWNTQKNGYIPKTSEDPGDGIHHINGYTDASGNTIVNPDCRGKWMHVYYTFIPEVSPTADYDHYIITLENNCTSSEGADYAIDDIRCYVCKPDLKARQTQPLCNGSTSTQLEMYADFDRLKTAYAFDETFSAETNVQKKFDYCFLDYDKYETSLKNSYENLSTYEKTTYPTLEDWREKASKANNSDFGTAYNTAFNAALLTGTYGSGNGATNINGVVILNTTYNLNSHNEVPGIRQVLFSTYATDANMQIGKKYIIAMIPHKEVTLTPNDFKLEDLCASVNTFEVTTKYGEIKIDGNLVSDQEGLRFCANQKPIVTINLNGIKQGGVDVKKENAIFDWYLGPLGTTAGYTAYNEEQKSGLYLSNAMEKFREEYPKASDLTSVTAKNDFTQSMLDYIREAVAAKKVILYQVSEALSTTDLYREERKTKFYLTAIPINPTPDDPSILYCLEPLQVSINLDTNSPSMKDGDDQNVVPYPADMNDVPLRIGLKQLRRTVIDGLSHTFTESDKLLWLPLREVNGSIEAVSSLKKHEASRKDFDVEPEVTYKATDDLVYLAASNDPAVLAGTSGAVDIITSGPTDPMWPIISDLKVVGKVQSIKAEKGNNNGSVAKLAFLEGFKFREGYEYTLKFHYEDDYTGVTGEHPTACPGDLVFTIKVVPEYQMWTGAVSRNWNDDRNWRRVTKEDLLWDDGRKTANVDYITDGGTNDNVESFAPADFTKVIIPAGVKHVPYMYDVRTGNSSVTYVGALRGGLQIANAVPTNETVIGKPTENVIYDMASINRPDNDVACRPWYDHTCDQIHFNSGAAMMDQRYLYYNKAWCDIEVPVGTWQTVASPLMNIVAGDLYLPTASARQDTPLFEDIFYDAGDSEHPALNDRFKPAVYQHSWNKSMAKVYELGGGQRNVGIKLDWSHVYNDVNVRYGAGQGFSIKVDVSAMDKANQPAKAKFRFPKADTQYTYYNPGNKDGEKKTETVVDGSKTADGADVQYNQGSTAKRPGRLADLTTATFQEVVGDNSNAATATSYFLVGNPLMCWLNMQEFFNKNPQFEPKYWTVTADGQQTALFSEERGWVSTSEDPKFLPPGVSFFVHLKQNQDGQAGASTTVAPDFKSSMMSYTQAEPRTDGSGSEDEHGNPTNDPAAGGNNNNNQQYNEDGSSNNAKTRSANSTMPQLHMTATDVSGRQSRALLMDGTMMEHEGVETLFDSNLKDDALLYTTKDGMAKTIASIAPGDTLPLAVSGARDEVQLSIEGVKDFDFDLFLIDSEEGTVEPLEGDIVLKQAASGVRYYIATRSKDDTEVEGDVNVPRVTAKDGYITVYAPAACEIETSAIYNTGGIRLDYAEHIAESHSVKLLPGIYIVHLLCDGKTYTYKLMLR